MIFFCVCVHYLLILMNLGLLVSHNTHHKHSQPSEPNHHFKTCIVGKPWADFTENGAGTTTRGCAQCVDFWLGIPVCLQPHLGGMMSDWWRQHQWSKAFVSFSQVYPVRKACKVTLVIQKPGHDVIGEHTCVCVTLQKFWFLSAAGDSTCIFQF